MHTIHSVQNHIQYVISQWTWMSLVEGHTWFVGGQVGGDWELWDDMCTCAYVRTLFQAYYFYEHVPLAWGFFKMLFYTDHTRLYVCMHCIAVFGTDSSYAQSRTLGRPGHYWTRIFLLLGQLRGTAEGQQKYSRCNRARITSCLLQTLNVSITGTAIVGLLRRWHPLLQF